MGEEIMDQNHFIYLFLFYLFIYGYNSARQVELCQKAEIEFLQFIQ